MADLRYAPEFRVEIDSRPIPAALRACITSVSCQSGLEGADRVELSLVNENLRWLDHELLALRRPLALDMGYATDRLVRMFVGEVVAQQASFPSSGPPTLTVVAQDARQRLQQGTKTRWFSIPAQSSNRPIPDPLIAAAVGAENGLISLVEPVGAALSMALGRLDEASAQSDPDATQKLIRKQAGESDFNFLTRIARENGWEMLIDHDGPLGGYSLRFMSPLSRLAPEVTLVYGQSLVEFNPRISEVGQVAGVTVKVWKPDMKMEFTVKLSWNWDRRSFDLSITPGYGIAGKESTFPEAFEAAARKAKSAQGAQAARGQAQALRQQAEKPECERTFMLAGEAVTASSAPRVLVSKLIPRLNSRLTGSGSAVGDPRIRPGVVISLEKLGRQFSGPYRVVSATHNLDSGGYRTSFEVRKEVWFEPVQVPSADALRPTMPGFPAS